MNKLNVLIATDPGAFRDALARNLSGSFCVHCCDDGNEARDYVFSRFPDVIVMDLILPELDGINLLREIVKLEHRPAVLVITTFCTEYILNALQKLQIGYLALKPSSPDAIGELVQDMAAQLCKKSCFHSRYPQDPEAIIDEMLLRLGFLPNYNGYRYLKQAILVMSQNSDVSLTKQLYPDVGAHFGSSGFQVERAIRLMVSTVWDRRNIANWEKYAVCDHAGNAVKPCNGALIARLTEELHAYIRENSNFGTENASEVKRLI